MENAATSMGKELKNMDLLDTRITEIKNEKISLVSFVRDPVFKIIIMVLIVIPILFVVGIRIIGKYSNTELHLVIMCLSLALGFSIISFLAYHLIALISSTEQRKMDLILSIEKERELAILSLRKSLASKILDSISFETNKEEEKSKK